MSLATLLDATHLLVDMRSQVLQEMAKRLPQGSFQKLGLTAGSLKTAFSSLTSDLTTMRTSGGSQMGLTLRKDRLQETSAHRDMRAESDTAIDQGSGWDIYPKAEIHKMKYDQHSKQLVEIALPIGVEGVAVFHYFFSAGIWNQLTLSYSKATQNIFKQIPTIPYKSMTNFKRSHMELGLIDH
jgi:hypothetical protein